jgi:hypothetical protein
MPYKLRKARGQNLYWVISEETGKKHSLEPLPLDVAEKQLKALYYAMGLEVKRKDLLKSKALRRKNPNMSRFQPGTDEAKEWMQRAREGRKKKEE